MIVRCTSWKENYEEPVRFKDHHESSLPFTDIESRHAQANRKRLIKNPIIGDIQPTSSQASLEHGWSSLRHCSWTVWKYSGFSEITGGIKGFSRAGRLNVRLDRWDKGVGGGGLYEWLRKARVCIVLVDTKSVTLSDIGLLEVTQLPLGGISIKEEK